MATSKTLTPTNVAIQIPDFTDQPDQRVNSNCIDKEADAINALNTQIANRGEKTKLCAKQGTGTVTLSDSIQNYKYLLFAVSFYDSGYTAYGVNLIPVSFIAVNTGSTFNIYLNFADGNVGLGFNSNTEMRIVSTYDTTRYVVVFGIK